MSPKATALTKYLCGSLLVLLFLSVSANSAGLARLFPQPTGQAKSASVFGSADQLRARGNAPSVNPSGFRTSDSGFIAYPSNKVLFGPAGFASLLAGPRDVRVVSPPLVQGTQAAVTIDLEAQGDENAGGFTLTFDNTKLTYVSSAKGSDIAAATLNVNTLQLASGRVGFAFAFPSEVTFVAGTRHVVVVTFNVGAAATGNADFGFGDSPIGREIADINANVLTTTYTGASVPIEPPPNPVPTITNVSPTNTLVGGAAFSLTVNGSNFVNTSVVRFGGTDLTTTFVNAGQLTAQVPASSILSAADVTVTVFNPAPGGGTSNGVNFAVNNPAPAITSLSPNPTTVSAGGLVLTVNGTGFVNGSTVRVSGSSRTTTFVSGTQLTAQLVNGDLSSAGTVPITVQNASPGGGTSSAVNLSVNNPVPTVTTLSPSSALTGGNAFTLTVNGTNFVNGSSVRISGNNRSTTFVSSTQLTASITAADIAAAGSFPITVSNAAPGGGVSNAVNLAVDNPVPTIVNLAPASIGAGGPAFSLTVNGTNFVSNSVVQLGGSNRTTTFVSATELTAAITAADIQNMGNAAITVVNPAPGGGTSNSVDLLVANPSPTLTSISPGLKIAGEADFVLTVNGSSFVNGAVVRLNGTDRLTTFVNAGQLTAQIPAADIQSAGAPSIAVFNPAPGGGLSNAVSLTVNNPLPAVIALNPAGVTAGAADFTLTVNGSSFVNGAVVKLAGSARTTTFVNSAQVTAGLTAADVASAGSFAVTVENPAPGGGASNAVNLQVDNPLPTLTSLSPATVIVASGAFTLTVNGGNFVAGSVVSFAGSARQTTFVNSGQLTAAITAADILNTGSFNITVDNPTPGGGTSVAVALAVENPVPTLSSISPISKTTGSADFVLTANGTDFVNGAVVRFNGSDRPTTFVNSSQVTAQISASDVLITGLHPITVFNPGPGGGSSNAVDLNVSNPGPNIQSLSPSTVIAGGSSFTLTVNGDSFVNGAVVRFNGNNRPTTFVNNSQLTADLSAADIALAGSFQVTVENPAPGGGVSNGANLAVDNPAPTISNLAPAIVDAGSSAFSLTVNGSDFVSGAVVKFAGSNRTTTFVSSTQLTASITSSDIQNTGNFAITVENPVPGGGSSNAIDLNVNNPVPNLVFVSPTNKTAGEAGFTLTAVGTNFVNGAVVRLNGIDRPTNYVSATQLTAQVDAASIQTAGILPVTVMNPAPGGGVSGSVDLTVNNPAPALTTISPVGVIAGGSGFTLTVNGSNFVAGSVVKFTGANRPTTFVNSTQLTADLTAADIMTAGVFSVAVESPGPGGGLSNALNLVVNNPLPTLTNISPTSVSAGDAPFILSLTGLDFVAGSIVRVNGNNRPTTFVDSGNLTAQVTALDIASPGTVAVTVFNPTPGGGTTGPLTLTINPPASGARALRVVNVTTLAASTFSVNIEMVAQGNENSWGFSIFYDPSKLNFISANLGPDASNASLLVNSTSSPNHIGVAQSLPAGESISPGLKRVLVLTFSVPTSVSPGFTELLFNDFPIGREVVDILASPLTTAYSSGVVTIAQGFEADVTPFPNGNTDGLVSIQDWAQIGRFMALLDQVGQGSEFQRADCAPMDSHGDGRVSVADWAQAGRFAAHLDAVPNAGGPTAPLTSGAPAMQANSTDDSPAETVVRLDRIGSATGERTLSVSLDAKGTENALGFSLLFDPTKLSFVGVEREPGSENAMMQVNSLGTSKGRLGVAMALPANQAFGVGSHQLFRINFKVLKDGEESPDPAFADLPIEREVADLKAARIRADFIKDSVARVNPIDGAQFFIQQHYSDFLGRKPDTEGLDYWTNQITECGDDARCIRDRRIRVSASFFMEQEFQQRGFFVHRLYKVLLGRQPSYAEFSRDRARLQSDDLEGAKISLIQEMLSRPDLEARYSADLTPEQFLDALFVTIRGGSGLDLQGERQALRNANEERGRAQVVLTLINDSRLVQAEYNPAFVLAEYFGYLRRDPDREGYDFWLNVLNNRVPNNYHSMVCAFITSAEYQRRFGDTAGRSNADCGP